jgi:hypothetical protein
MAIRKSSTSGTPFGDNSNRPLNAQIGQTYNNGQTGYQEIYTAAGWIPATGANDFSINVTGTHTSVTFAQSYSAGSYTISSSSNDTTMDVYALDSSNTVVGYTPTKSLTTSERFNKIVVIGGSNGDTLGFSYKPTFIASSSTSEITTGAFITSISPSAMPNANDTITITGGNFANNVAVNFSGSGYSSTPAKNIVRTSSSSLIVTRPDNFPISASPYTVTVLNPSVTNAPIASNAHISSNSVTAGTSPVWNTSATLPTFTRNSAYSTVLSATDPDSGGSITYSIVSGSLPTGLTLTSLTGGISGTPTSSTTVTFTVRATDAGGNFVDRAFTLPNTGPVWSTSASLSNATKDSAYSTTLVATDDSGNAPTYTLISGSVPAGLSFNAASGVISGTPSAGSNGTASSFTIRATDANGNTADRAFTLYVMSPQLQTFTSSGTWVAPVSTSVTYNIIGGGGGAGGANSGSGNSGGGGGGAAIMSGTFNTTSGTSYVYTVGGGGGGSTGNGTAGSASSIFGITANPGQPGLCGDCGGSGGASGNGNSGGGSGSSVRGSGGGGAGGAGTSAGGGGHGGPGATASINSTTYAGGGGGGGYGNSPGNGGSGGGGSGGNSTDGNSATANTGSGGGAGGYISGRPRDTSGGTGASGRIMLSYLG